MKAKILILLIICFAAGPATYADLTPTVEFKGPFIKITAGTTPEGVPVDRDVPRLLYIRKTSIIRISILDSQHVSRYSVEIVTSGLVMGSNSDDHAVAVVSASKAYAYHFTDVASAMSFCDSLLSQ